VAKSVDEALKKKLAYLVRQKVLVLLVVRRRWHLILNVVCAACNGDVGAVNAFNN